MKNVAATSGQSVSFATFFFAVEIAWEGIWAGRDKELNFYSRPPKRFSLARLGEVSSHSQNTRFVPSCNKKMRPAEYFFAAQNCPFAQVPRGSRVNSVHTLFSRRPLLRACAKLRPLFEHSLFFRIHSLFRSRPHEARFSRSCPHRFLSPALRVRANLPILAAPHHHRRLLPDSGRPRPSTQPRRPVGRVRCRQIHPEDRQKRNAYLDGLEHRRRLAPDGRGRGLLLPRPLEPRRQIPRLPLLPQGKQNASLASESPRR